MTTAEMVNHCVITPRPFTSHDIKSEIMRMHTGCTQKCECSTLQPPGKRRQPPNIMACVAARNKLLDM